jgi:hypothetical protein
VPRLLIVQQLVGVLCLGLVALIVAANLGCAPKYFQRVDVIALLFVALVDGVLLLGASSGDSDTHRVIGVGASASAVALLLATVSLPALAAPLAIAGAFRLPRPGQLRSVVPAVIAFAIVATAGLLFVAYTLVPAEQLRCP